MRSSDNGLSWEMTTLAPADYRYMDGSGSRVIAGQRNSLMLSEDRGQNWKAIPMPPSLSGVGALALSEDGALWAGGREGVFYSKSRTCRLAKSEVLTTILCRRECSFHPEVPRLSSV